MAETRREVVAKTTRVYIPEPGVHVQTAHSDQYPGGRVIHLTHGWQDLDEELSSSPQLSRLVREDDSAREEAHKQELARALAVQEAQDKFTADSIKLDNDRIEAMTKADLERAAKVEEALAKGEAVPTEPAVDPAAAHAVVLTADNERLMVSAAGMAAKWNPADFFVIPDPPATALPENVDVPHVSGDAVVGGMLACTLGNWNNMSAEPHSYAYQWKSDATDVVGTANYQVKETDAGHTITCVVTATNTMGPTAAPPSNGVAIPAAPGGETRTAGGTRRATA